MSSNKQILCHISYVKRLLIHCDPLFLKNVQGIILVFLVKICFEFEYVKK